MERGERDRERERAREQREASERDRASARERESARARKIVFSEGKGGRETRDREVEA